MLLLTKLTKTHPTTTFSHAFQRTRIGWSDATTGPLLLRIQSHYSVSYPIVSLLFICAFVGFFTAAVINIWLTDKIGYGKALVFASSCQVSVERVREARVFRVAITLRLLFFFGQDLPLLPYLMFMF